MVNTFAKCVWGHAIGLAVFPSPKLTPELQNSLPGVFSFPCVFAMISGTPFCAETLMRPVLVCAVLLSGSILFPLISVAQTSDGSQQGESAICAFEDGKQLTARYNPMSTSRADGPPGGKVLMPGGAAMTFFTETDLVLGQSTIPTGGYTMYIIPAKKEWTLIVSKNTAVDAKYDEKQDLARAQMETGQLSSPADKLSLYFGHIGPKKCEINVDFGKTRGWVAFAEK
jgi:hypothetical protein